ncbi:Uncharacterised protein [Mycobacteroides abscessus subsp. abscessus]|nr:Uncharacterised protein [Mycobacteroides abscessus subsp. abscessus]
MAAAITPILQAGADDGSLRGDVQAGDVVLLIAGSLMPVRDDAARTQRLLRIGRGSSQLVGQRGGSADTGRSASRAHCVVGEHAVFAAAVDDDLGVGG